MYLLKPVVSTYKLCAMKMQEILMGTDSGLLSNKPASLMTKAKLKIDKT